MGNVGDEIAAALLHALGLSKIASTATAPPPGMGAAVTSKMRPGAMVFERAEVTIWSRAAS